jgi:hypothetical protein
VDGLFLAAFQRPSDAILWALECNEAMIKQVGTLANVLAAGTIGERRAPGGRVTGAPESPCSYCPVPSATRIGLRMFLGMECERPSRSPLSVAWVAVA